MKQKAHRNVRLLWMLFFGIAVVFQANAQTISIKGSVVDDSGLPVIGASVVVQGTTNGASTDVDGNFSLTNVAANGTLQISYLGYKTQIIPVSNQTQLFVKLIEDSQLLDEVVVVGYGVQRKSDLTGSVASVKASDALKALPSGNVTDALQGRMAGVSIVSGSGDPTQDNTVRIRGINSITAEGGPLVVVDGFIGGSLQALNPADIESIEVLKDASATAVYGSRGANGVILVTTKNPTNNNMVITFNSFLSLKTIAKKPDMLSPYEFAQLANAYGKEYNESMGKSPVEYYNADQLAAFKNGTDGYDYFDSILRDPALSQNYEVSIAGGGDKTSVLASVRYNKSEGIIEKNYRDIYNYRLKVDTKVKKWLDLGLNFSGYYSNGSGPRLSQYNGLLLSAMYFPNTVKPKDEDGNYNHRYPISGTATYNPMGHINEVDKKNTRLNNNLQGYVNFNILDGLTFRSQLGVEFTNLNNTESQNSNSYHAFTNGGLTQAYAYSSNAHSWLNTNTLNYMKELNSDHRINATAVFEQSYSNTYWHRSEANGLDFPDRLGANSLESATANLAKVSSARTINTLQSWMLRANYVFKNRYMLTASIRGDGSSRLADKWDYFPSAAVAWDMKQEAFLKDVDFLNQLKLRVGYGSVGNQSVEAYRRFSQMVATVNADGTTSYQVGRPASPYLVWEKNNQTNIGLDVAFFNGRLTVNADWYNKTSKDILLELKQPVHVGFPQLLQNAGELENKGFEVTISGDPIVTKDWGWHTDVTLSQNKGIFKKIPTKDKMQIQAGSYENTVMRMIEGEKIGTFWGFNSEGVWQEDEVKAPFIDADGNATGKTMGETYGVAAGNAKYTDVNKDGKIDNSDAGIIGNGQPSFNWGWNNTFRYRDFDLSVFIIGFHGFDIYNATDQIGYNTVSGQNFDNISPKKAFLNRWTKENPNTDIPGFVYEKNPVKGFSSRFVEKGDFIKVKSITLGYSLPLPVCRSLHINNLRLYASIQNPFMITSYDGLDPESTLGTPLTQGVDWGSYPNGRNYMFGLNFSF